MVIKIEQMPKRKITPFARLFIALIIIVPLAFFGASYINGEDPMENLKQLTGSEEKVERVEQPTPSSTEPAAELESKVEELQKVLRERDKEIEQLRQQLEDCE